MSITIDNIHRIAHLARLHIDEANIPRYVENLNNLLQLVEQMNAVDTQGITPMSHPLPHQTQRFREDQVKKLSAEEIQRVQKIAPQVMEQLYLVPKVIE